MDESPLEQKPLAHCSFVELLDALASDAIMPGAGTAGGIALALAAACAGKAVAISLRHDGNDQRLQELQRELARCKRHALQLAEADALQFRQYLQSNDAAAASALLHTDRTLVEQSHQLDALLDQHAHRIAANMHGDWQAARTLSHACRLIEQGNVQELRSGG